jgi:hypothetical protein
VLWRGDPRHGRDRMGPLESVTFKKGLAILLD